MNYFDTLFVKKYGVGGGSMFATLFGKSLGGDTPTPVMPSKGDIIAVDMNGDGTAENYLVLKEVSEGVYELLARVNYGNTTFASSGQMYQGGNLDLLLNATYYNTLSATAKAAIVDKTFRQDSWYRNTSGNPDYNGTYTASKTAYQVSLGNASFGNEISRHVYALSVQDIIDYLEVTTEMTAAESTLNMENIQAMFDITSENIWLRSADAVYTSYALRVNGDGGRVNSGNATNSYAARPAFQLDLTKIEWTPVEA